jgi:hypothetical protein
MMQSRSSSGTWASRQKPCSFAGLIIVLREGVAIVWSRIEIRESWGSRLVVDGCVPSHHRPSRAAFESCKKSSQQLELRVSHCCPYLRTFHLPAGSTSQRLPDQSCRKAGIAEAPLSFVGA